MRQRSKRASSRFFGTSIVCAIVNTGSKPVAVSANVLNFYNGSDATMGTSCPASPATLPPGAGCAAYGTYSGPHAGYCRFSAQGGKVRGSLLVQDTQGYVTSSLAASK
jgi:hypothetical protein